MARDPILVVIFLRGGADGLALVSPRQRPRFHRRPPRDPARPAQGRRAGRAIRQDIADVDFRFHQRAAPLADLYDAGDLSLIHAAGLTEPPAAISTPKRGSSAAFSAARPP